MTVAFYDDYILKLRTLFAELDGKPDQFQTFNVRLELAVAGGLIVYETKRYKGQTDSLYYGRSGENTANQRMAQAAAFSAIERFFALGQFLALAGKSEAAKSSDSPLDGRYPHCAVNFSYRKKGHPSALSMLMVFVGFNDEADALEYASGFAGSDMFVETRPYRSSGFHEWK